jgi:hypothetical protein
MGSDPKHELLADAFGCCTCSAALGFSRPRAGAGYYKFPPTIGAAGHADILFIGINPARRKPSGRKNAVLNRRLHEDAARSIKAFRLLAANRKPDAEGRDRGRYIKPGGEESFYEIHSAVVSELYGHRATLENHAAVTELFLCATPDSAKLYSQIKSSPCATKFLDRTIQQATPKVVVALGSAPDKYFRERAGTPSELVFKFRRAPLDLWLVPVPFPRYGWDKPRRVGKVAPVVASWIREIIAGNEPRGVPELAGSLDQTWLRLIGPSSGNRQRSGTSVAGARSQPTPPKLPMEEIARIVRTSHGLEGSASDRSNLKASGANRRPPARHDRLPASSASVARSRKKPARTKQLARQVGTLAVGLTQVEEGIEVTWTEQPGADHVQIDVVRHAKKVRQVSSLATIGRILISVRASGEIAVAVRALSRDGSIVALGAARLPGKA